MKANIKKKLREALSELNRIRIGDTLYLFDDDSAEGIERKVNRALGRGKTVVRYSLKDKKATVTEWYDDMLVMDHSKDGSDKFTWDKSGNRVKHERYHFIQEAGWTRKRFVKIVWKAF